MLLKTLCLHPALLKLSGLLFPSQRALSAGPLPGESLHHIPIPLFQASLREHHRTRIRLACLLFPGRPVFSSSSLPFWLLAASPEGKAGGVSEKKGMEGQGTERLPQTQWTCACVCVFVLVCEATSS